MAKYSRRYWSFLSTTVASMFVLLPLYNNCSETGFKANLMAGPPPSFDFASQGPGFKLGVSSGLRPLTVREYNASVRAILKDSSNPGSLGLPRDAFIPFDNYFEYAITSPAKVEAFEVLSSDVAASLMKDDARLKAVLPCVPISTTDQACLAMVVDRMGMQFLRRPLTNQETTQYLNAVLEFAKQGASYKSGVEVFIRVMLQHPDFVYRAENGTPLSGVGPMFAYSLNDFEFASKLSFTLWGEPPSLELLDAAKEKKFSDKKFFENLVEKMLNDPRALDHLDFFHAAWFGYANLDPAKPINLSMRAESKAMVKRIVFDENRPWREILSLNETFVNQALAQHYGLPAPSNPNGAWVRQTDPLRKGLLGTGSFLSVGAKFGDTSPTQRGYAIRKQIFCETISPPPANVSTDNPPRDDSNPSPCKEVQLKASVLKTGTACLNCHSRMDYIGLGLENYSANGVFRTAQANASQCAISGQGEVVGYGHFKGPAGLADVALQSGRAEYCLVQRWIQFSNGIKTDSKIMEMTASALPDFKADGNLKNFIQKQVLSDSFRVRRPLE